VGFLLSAGQRVFYVSQMKKRAAFYVDGFNLYHSIAGLGDDRLKWLSLAGLASMLIPSRDEQVASISYFSALATKRGGASVSRHRSYIAALQAEGVEPVLGRFKDQPRRCFNCQNKWMHPEEKETDVNIAIRMVSDAYRDLYDVCYLVSADTDLVPPLALIKQHLPQKEIVAVSPPNRPHGQHIRTIAHRSLKLNRHQIERCRLPDTITVGVQTITCPPDYM
jgi:uncharacterized LabA/DUF88 family protein